MLVCRFELMACIVECECTVSQQKTYTLNKHGLQLLIFVPITSICLTRSQCFDVKGQKVVFSKWRFAHLMMKWVDHSYRFKGKDYHWFLELLDVINLTCQKLRFRRYDITFWDIAQKTGSVWSRQEEWSVMRIFSEVFRGLNCFWFPVW